MMVYEETREPFTTSKEAWRVSGDVTSIFLVNGTKFPITFKLLWGDKRTDHGLDIIVEIAREAEASEAKR